MFFVNAGFVAYTMRFYSIISDCFVVLSYQSFQAQYNTKAAGTQAVQAFPLPGKTAILPPSVQRGLDGKCNINHFIKEVFLCDVTGFLRYMLEAGRTERVAG